MKIKYKKLNHPHLAGGDFGHLEGPNSNPFVFSFFLFALVGVNSKNFMEFQNDKQTLVNSEIQLHV